MATNKKAAEWFDFMLGALIVMVAVFLVLVLYMHIKAGGETASAGILASLGRIFK